MYINPIFDEFMVVFLSFFVYCLIGWTYESFVWAKCELKYFTNRGYLLGPCCPIYGFVSLMDWYVLGGFTNPIVIFFVGAIVCTIFEFITHWTLEKIFHRRWWDYSNYPLNLNGRISVPSSFFFGLAGVLLVKVVHPTTTGIVRALSQQTRFAIFILVALAFISDLLITTISLCNGSKRIKTFYTRMHDSYEAPFEHLTKAFDPFDQMLSQKLARFHKTQDDEEA